MQSSSNMDDLTAYFTDKVQLMTRTLLLRDVYKDTDDVKLLRSLNDSISDLKIVLFNMKQQLAKQKRDVEQFQALKELMQSHKSNLQHAEKNLPAKLPKFITPAAPDVCKPPESNLSDQKSAELKKPARNLKLKKGPYIRSMDYVMIEEFDQVPKYMKGRITYDQVNNVVDEFNKAITKKYEILYLPKAEQTEQMKKKIVEFKKQESKDTKGFYFVTEEDLGKLSSLKMTSIARSILTILRHTGRLKLIRGGGPARHALA